jgi:hypothetical protein
MCCLLIYKCGNTFVCMSVSVSSWMSLRVVCGWVEGAAGFNRIWVRRTYRLGGLIGSADLRPADWPAESPV